MINARVRRPAAVEEVEVPSVDDVADVFRAAPYMGTGAAYSLPLGIDLATHGGLVFLKSRSALGSFLMYDTARGATKQLSVGVAQSTEANGLTSFNANGFTLGSSSDVNALDVDYASWTFRKHPRFLDVVTYTGTGIQRSIPHGLVGVPGMIIIKRLDSTSIARMRHINMSAAAVVNLSTAGSVSSAGTEFVAHPTATHFTVGTGAVTNAAGGLYVAYLFAHDTAADGMIQCGVVTGSGTAVDLGWEPQCVFIKNSGPVDNRWFDTERGMGYTDHILTTNGTAAEDATAGYIDATRTGFVNYQSGTNYYMAIRRSMRLPTIGGRVFNSVPYLGDGAAQRAIRGAGFNPDLHIGGPRALGGHAVYDRIRATTAALHTPLTGGQTPLKAPEGQFVYNGMTVSATSGYLNTNGENYYSHFFKRAPGFLDVQVYAGTGAAMSVQHCLGRPPKLILLKNISGAGNWGVYHANAADTHVMVLNGTNAAFPSTFWNNTPPTDTHFSVNADAVALDQFFVAYLFGEVPGVSKMGYYFADGNPLWIDCGFSTGARYVLIKRYDAPGNWMVWDTGRGIFNAANDPYLILNNTIGEQWASNCIEPYAAGFHVPSTNLPDVYTPGGVYVYFAIG